MFGPASPAVREDSQVEFESGHRASVELKRPNFNEKMPNALCKAAMNNMLACARIRT